MAGSIWREHDAFVTSSPLAHPYRRQRHIRVRSLDIHQRKWLEAFEAYRQDIQEQMASVNATTNIRSILQREARLERSCHIAQQMA